MHSLANALSRSVHFIAWGNFTRLEVYTAWAGAFGLLALVAWLALAAGSLCAPNDEESATESLVVGFATGCGAWVAVLFAIAVVHALRPAVVLGLALVAVLAPVGRRRSLLGLLDPGRTLARAVREEPWLWLLFTACSLPALLPPYRWDETAYHLAQAEQWLRAGGLTVDPFLRYPLNATNWQLLESAVLMLHSDSVMHLLTWFAGVLASLCVGLFLRRLGVGLWLRYAAVVAFFVTPLVQELLTVGLIDVPLMFCFTVGVYTLFRFPRSAVPDSRAVAGAALTAGAFIGMKITAVLFLPLFVGLALYRLAGRRRVIYVAVLLCASAPWYVRNTAVAGDPVTPALGPLLHRQSLYWSDWDRDAQAADLHHGLSWSPGAVISLPLRTLRSTDSGPLRGWPLLGYIAVFPLSILVSRRLWRESGIDPFVAAWYGAVVWVATSYHLRYAMFLPLAVVCAAYVLWAGLATLQSRIRAVGDPRWGQWLQAVAGTVFLIGPTPAAAQYIKNDWARAVPAGNDTAAWVATLGPCEAAVWRQVKSQVRPPARLYLVNLSPLKYELQRVGYRAIGDDFHAGRWTDFWRAVDSRAASPFLRQLPIDYVVLCASYPPERRGSWTTTIAVLRADSGLEPAIVDSTAAVFRLPRAAGGSVSAP